MAEAPLLVLRRYLDRRFAGHRALSLSTVDAAMFLLEEMVKRTECIHAITFADDTTERCWHCGEVTRDLTPKRIDPEQRFARTVKHIERRKAG